MRTFACIYVHMFLYVHSRSYDHMIVIFRDYANKANLDSATTVEQITQTSLYSINITFSRTPCFKSLVVYHRNKKYESYWMGHLEQGVQPSSQKNNAARKLAGAKEGDDK